MLATALTAASLPTEPAAADESGIAATEITNGYVEWGIKESWRDYITKAGTTPSGGAEWADGDIFRLPISSGSFDADTNELKLDLDGKVHFQAYCEDSGICLLDSTFENLSLTISEDEQVISGDQWGRPEDNPGGDFEMHSGVFGVMDIYDAEPQTEDGTTTWSKIPAKAGDALALYSAGTPSDPITIVYNGPGGKPQTSERWGGEGAPTFEPSAEALYEPLSDQTRQLYSASSGDYLLGFEIPRKNRSPQTVTAYDSSTLEILGRDDMPSAARMMNPSFDPTSGTLFSAINGFDENDPYAVALQSIRWNGSEFEIDRISTIPSSSSNSIVWNSVTNELLWMTERTDDPNAHLAQKFTKEQGTWVESTNEVTLKGEINNLPAAQKTRIFGSNTALTGAVTRDGSYIFSPGSRFKVDGADHATELVRLIEDDGAWEASFIPGTTLDFDAVPHPQAYVTVDTASDGSVITGYANTFNDSTALYIDVVDGEVTTETVPAFPGMDKASAYHFASDKKRGYDYLLDSTQMTISVMKDRKNVELISIPEYAGARKGNGMFTVVPDGAIVMEVKNSDGEHVLRRYDLVGITPTITAQPTAEQTVSLTQGAASGEAQLSVRFEADDTTVQWQHKRPADARFTYIEGAEGAEYAPEVSLADNGIQYRAVVSNAAGKVPPAVATVNVESAPLFASQPKSLNVADGDTAVFTAPVSAEVAAQSQRWERQVDGQWVAIESNDVFTVEGDKLTIETSEAVNGAVFRSVIANSVGENVSDEATLTVQAGSTIPEEGLDYTGVTFEWDISKEMQSKPPVGGSQYFTAGASDGGAGTYSAAEGNVKIEHVAADGTRTTPTYETRSAFIASGGKQVVSLSGGQAKVMPDGSATVNWEGTFSVNMYGGMVPFTFTNPVLTIDGNGVGTLTADMSGYASSMDNPSDKEPLEPRQGVRVATFNGASVDTLNPFTVNPDYAGVVVTIPEGSDADPQRRDVEGLGSWPGNFVDFQLATGLSSYWYSSGSGFDPKKAPNGFVVDFTGAEVVDPGGEDEERAPLVTQHPASVEVEAGQSATFTAAASGTPAPTVQWQQKIADGDWTDVESAGTLARNIEASYTIDDVALGASGLQLRAVFSNGVGDDAISEPATLTVTDPTDNPVPGDGVAPEITAQPKAVEVKPGEDASFTAAASGTPAPKVQWQQLVGDGEWSDINGAGEATYTVSGAQLTASGTQYRAVFSNGVGDPAVTVAATLTVTAPEPPKTPETPDGENKGDETDGDNNSDENVDAPDKTDTPSGNGDDSGDNATSGSGSGGAAGGSGSTGGGDKLSNTGADEVIPMTLSGLAVLIGLVCYLGSRRKKVAHQ